MERDSFIEQCERRVALLQREMSSCDNMLDDAINKGWAGDALIYTRSLNAYQLEQALIEAFIIQLQQLPLS